METKYYKILNQEMIHNGFQYKMGLNIDTKEFNPKGSCEYGGLYYTTEEFIHKFFEYGCFIAEIEIPSDAKVYADPTGDRWKTDRLIITKINPIYEHKIGKDFLQKKFELDRELYLIKKDIRYLLCVQQTPELCKAVIKYDWRALQYVKEQTPEICLKAIKRCTDALQYVKEQTKQICLEAVKLNGHALKFVKNQTPEICLEAIKKRYECNLEFVKEQTPEICLEAVKNEGYNLRYVKEQTPEICLEAVKQDSSAYKYVKPEFRTWSLLFKAILRTL